MALPKPCPRSAASRPAAASRAAPPPPARHGTEEPFASAEQAWFWTIAGLLARRDGAGIATGTGGGGSGVVRPCDPDDVIRCLDALYRQRRIDLVHARVLREWGERQIAPDSNHPRERQEARLWREALDRLAWPLRVKGIVR